MVLPREEANTLVGFRHACLRGGAPPGRYSTSSDSLGARPHETLTSTAAHVPHLHEGLGLGEVGEPTLKQACCGRPQRNVRSKF